MDSETVHTSHEDSILTVGIPEKPFTNFQNQVMATKIELKQE